MEITSHLKKRFCKDCNVPISIFSEPYFTDRLELYDSVFGTLKKWERFCNSLNGYSNEQEYFEEYNRVKDAAIEDIKSSYGYQQFNTVDMNNYAVVNTGFPKNDIFKPSNDGKSFISIDMKKANFSALRSFNREIFNGANTWEEFISQYTNNEHIINSKYIRQVILGNCNPKRHITYEKHIMDKMLSILLISTISEESVVFFSNDEIVVDITNVEDGFSKALEIWKMLKDNIFGIDFRVEKFTLHKIKGTEGYYKEIDMGQDTAIEFKCLNNFTMPFVLRAFNGEEVTESDRVFLHEGRIAKYIDDIEIEF